MCSCMNGMKRRKKISGLKDVGSIATGILPILGGYLLANVVEKKFLAGTTYGNIVKLGGGLALASMGKGAIAQIGIGMALNGAVDIAEPALQSAGLGLLPPGQPARYLAGFNDGQQFPFKAWP